MRTQMFGTSLLLAAALVGCGDDDGGGGQIILPDAKVFMDAPTQTVTCSVDMAGIQALSLGTMQQRAGGDFFVVPEAGSPNAGATVFLLAAGLPGSTQQVADILAVEVVKGAAFATNTPYPFETDPGATTYTAASYILGDFNRSAMTLGNFYWATSGQATLSAIGEANGNAITGTVNTTNYAEIDENSAIITGGCTTSMMGLGFFLTQMASSARVELPSWDDGAGGKFSQDEVRFIIDTIQRRKQQLAK